MSRTADSPAITRAWVADKVLMGQPVGEYVKSLVTPFNFFSGVILAVGIPVIIYRFAYGLGAATNLSQTTPWGIWIALDVLCGVALAAGGYTMACAVYVFGMKQYYPVVRPAILTGFLGYVFVVFGLAVDLGRPYRLPIPIFFSHGLTSVMFEVGWCVALYATVLGFEFLPAVLEWLGFRKARQIAVKMTMGLVVFGVMLSTLHQSSLGSLFLMAPTKIHPLWYSPYLPLFFFISSIVAGLSMVIFESSLSHRIFKDQVEPGKHVDIDGITLGLGKAASIVLFAYLFLKLQGLADSGAWALLSTPLGYWFLFEILGFVLLPCLLFAHGVRTANVGLVRKTAAWTVLGIVVNRFNVAFIAFNWNVGNRYFPSWMEIMTSVTIITIGVLTFRWIVNRMPILHEHPAYEGTH
jgi:Ni/Fe-hydrogenase subunit HybB-like protein